MRGRGAIHLSLTVDDQSPSSSVAMLAQGIGAAAPSHYRFPRFAPTHLGPPPRFAMGAGENSANIHTRHLRIRRSCVYPTGSRIPYESIGSKPVFATAARPPDRGRPRTAGIARGSRRHRCDQPQLFRVSYNSFRWAAGLDYSCFRGLSSCCKQTFCLPHFVRAFCLGRARGGWFLATKRRPSPGAGFTHPCGQHFVRLD